MLVPLVFRAALTLTAVAAPDVDEGPTRVVYLGTPGTARAAAFRTFLDERFDEVVVADWRTARSTMALRYGGVSAVVLDGAYEDGRPFLPIREYDVGFGAIDTPPLVVIGAAGRAVARAHGLMGADGRADDGRTVHVPPHPTLAPDGGAVAVSTAGRRFGARLGPLRDEPWLEVLAEGGAGEDALAVVFRQGNVLHFGFEADPGDLTPDGRRLLARSIEYATRFGEYHHAALPLALAEPPPPNARARLALDPEDPSFLRGVTRLAEEASDAADRAAARQLLARYLPRDAGTPHPAAPRIRWDEWLDAFEAYLAFSRWRGDRWVFDRIAYSRRTPSAELRGPARAGTSRDPRGTVRGAPSDGEVRDALDVWLSGRSDAWEGVADVIGKARDRAALELVHRFERTDDPVVRCTVIRLLGRVGRSGVHALPALDGALTEEDPAVRRAAATALGAIGGAAVPALERALLDDAPSVRRRAAGSLFTLGHEATPAADALAEVVRRDPDPRVRTYACMALLRCRRLGEEHARALDEAAGDPDETVRFWAGAALDRQRPRPPSERVLRLDEPLDETARTAAVAALADEDPNRRTRAAFTLARRADRAALDAETRERLDAVLETWIDEMVHRVDGENFSMGPAGVDVLRNVELCLPGMAADLLRYPRFPVRPVSFQPFLPILRRAGEDAIPALVLCLDHWYLGDSIGLEGLSHLGRGSRFAFPALVERWSRLGDWPGDEAFIRRCGPWFEDRTDHRTLLAATLVPELLEALRHDDDFVRNAAAALLRTVNPLLPEEEASLAARLTPDEPDPVGVVDALARRDLGPETRAALARFLRDDGRVVLRVVAARAADLLDGVEVPDPPAVGSVVSTDDPRVVLAALEHLESLGPAAAPAVPALRAALSALARPTDAGLATLLRIKGLPRALAAAGAAGVDALVATYPAFLTDDSSLRTTDAGRFGPREPCAEIEFALLAAGPPAARALDDLLTDGPRPLSPPVRAEIAWLRSLFEIAP